MNCGVNGSVPATGAIGFGAEGITTGTLDVRGGLDAGVTLGLDMLYVYQKELLKKIITHQGFPGFEIHCIIVVGPEITLEVRISLQVKAEGRTLGGASISVPDAVAHCDMFDSSKPYTSG